MSASDPNSAIYVTDSPKDIKNKVWLLTSYTRSDGFSLANILPSLSFLTDLLVICFEHRFYLSR